MTLVSLAIHNNQLALLKTILVRHPHAQLLLWRDAAPPGSGPWWSGITILLATLFHRRRA